MKYLILAFVMSMLLVGCSSYEVLRIGEVVDETNSKDQLKISTTEMNIKDNGSLEQLKNLFDDLEPTAQTDLVEKQPDLLFNLGEEGKYAASIWLQDNGSAIILRKDNHYYILPKEKMEKIKSYLNN